MQWFYYKCKVIYFAKLPNSLFSISSTYPTELEAQLNAAEILGQELNTKMEKTEAEMETLKAADQGTSFRLCLNCVLDVFPLCLFVM